nr:DUF2235 domain-containing protein [Pseudomonas syringae]
MFFDGTNNNEKSDTEDGHPTNIAKLFHASLRGTEANEQGYFSYYMPGAAHHSRNWRNGLQRWRAAICYWG